jgi:predicted ATPase
MITRFAIANFKNLARIPGEGDIGVPFGSLNVLIGPNGCGKSSLLQAIDFLRAFFRTSVEVYLQEREWDFKDLPNLRETSKSIRWELEASLHADAHGHGAGAYRYVIVLQPRRHLGVGEEILQYWPEDSDPDSEPITLISRVGRRCAFLDRSTETLTEVEMLGLPASVMSRWDPQADRRRYPEALRFREWVEAFRYFLLWDPKILRSPSRGKHSELGSSGDHLASIVGRLKDKHPERFAKLVRRIRRLIPHVTDISVSGRQGWGWRTIRLHEANGKEIVFNSQQMSDGVLRLLAVTVLLYLEQIPSVLMFEEPENGVHPQLIREIVQVLQELTRRKPPHKCQVFCTTHSPYVLDEFYDHPEQVYCMDRRHPQSGARIVRLSDNKQLKTIQNGFSSLGEAWYSGLIGATAGIKLR